jgi:hypothetical protein
MFRRCAGQEQQGSDSVMVCIIAGSGLGLSLGVIFGIAFDNMASVLIGAAYGALMGLAIGRSIKEYKEYSSS